jgi:hypothetical protein
VVAIDEMPWLPTGKPDRNRPANCVQHDRGDENILTMTARAPAKMVASAGRGGEFDVWARLVNSRVQIESSQKLIL